MYLSGGHLTLPHYQSAYHLTPVKLNGLTDQIAQQ